MASDFEANLINRFQYILTYPIAQRCCLLTDLLMQCSYKEVHSLFPLLVESIFGFGSHPGWGLKQICRRLQSKDFDVLRRFLSPEGTMMKLVYQLMNDIHLKYEFPTSCLPVSICRVPPFYANKTQILQQDAAGQTAPYLSLNPFEFYIFHLTYFLLGSQHQQVECEYSKPISSDTLYAYVVEDFLHYFLPCDANYTPPPPYFPLRQTKSLDLNQTLTKDRSVSPVSSGKKSSPFRSLLKQPSVSRQTSAASLLTKEVGQVELWRSEVLVQAIIDFWLSHYSLETNRTLFSSPDKVNSMLSKCSGMEDRYLQQCLPFLDSFFPSSDHIRLVRMFVKHLHYFANSSRPNTANAFDEFKQIIIPHFLKKKLYNFIKHMFDHWPLDASFRLVLELWLSYIQPWRYVDLLEVRGHLRDISEEKDRFISKTWQPFIEENLLFYSVFFQRMIQRLCRTELDSPKNANMLHRLSKVFSQPNLSTIIRDAETLLQEPLGSSMVFTGISGRTIMSRSATEAGHAAIIRQQICELEEPNFTYVPLFDYSVKVQVQQMISIINNLRRNRKDLRPPEEKRSSGIWSYVRSALMLNDDDDASAMKEEQRMDQYLDIATVQLSQLFEIRIESDIIVKEDDSADLNQSDSMCGLQSRSMSSFTKSILTVTKTKTSN